MMEMQKIVASQAREDEAFAATATGSLAEIVEAGARILIGEPWRVSRIVPGADAMTIDDLVAQVARRCSAGAPADIDRAIALAQLHAALRSSRFHSAWAHWRGQSER